MEFRNVNCRTRAIRSMRTLGAVTAVLALSVATASAQTLSAPSLGNASSPNESSGSSANPSFQRFSATSTLSSGATSFATRYFGNASADCGPACGSRTETLSSNYTVSWTATAPNLYSLSIATQRSAGLTIGDDGSNGAQATMGALSCTPSGGTVTSGACTLGDPADNTSGSSTDVNVNQTNTLNVCGQSLGSPVNHSVNFVWSQTAFSPSTGFIQINMDEAAVRLGANNLDASNGAANYPGTGARTQSNDGHFVTVTLTNLCGNGVIDTCGANSEQCDQGSANGSFTSCCTSACTFKTVGTQCRASAGVCDIAETCTGSGATCPADAFEPNTTECRASAGICDVAENCTGSGAACPADALRAQHHGVPRRRPASATWPRTARVPAPPAPPTCQAARPSAAAPRACATSPSTATASATTARRMPWSRPHGLPRRGGRLRPGRELRRLGRQLPRRQLRAAPRTCRPSAGACDVAENCDGANSGCPADAIEPATTTCRAAAGACDVAENCDGATVNCPADSVSGAFVTCRPIAGAVRHRRELRRLERGLPCRCRRARHHHLPRRRLASATSPTPVTASGLPARADAKSTAVCRGSAGICDVAETCDGITDNCPADAFQPASAVCRASANTCDIAETCTGSSAACPADTGQPDGDSDTVCDAIDNCDTIANTDQANNDSDSFGDACDPCTNIVPTVPSKTKLILSKLLAPTTDDKLNFKGFFTAVPNSPTVDPVTNGLRVLVSDSLGNTPIDVTIPGGAYNPVTKIGWKVNGSGTAWKYKNSTSPVNGLYKAQLKAYSSTPGKYKFAVKGKNGNYAVNTANLPLKGTLVIDVPFAETASAARRRSRRRRRSRTARSRAAARTSSANSGLTRS